MPDTVVHPVVYPPELRHLLTEILAEVRIPPPSAGEIAAQLAPRFRDLLDTAVERGRQHIEEDALVRLQQSIECSRSIPDAEIRRLAQAAFCGADRVAASTNRARTWLAVVAGMALAVLIGCGGYSIGASSSLQHSAAPIVKQ